jgi:hypothetical protein
MPSLSQMRYAIAKSALRAPLVWRRHRGLNRSDVFVASYPRSGSTWLRFLLFEVLTKRDGGFDDVNSYIPDVGDHQGAVKLLPNEGRFIKTHEAFRSDYQRAIYVVRDVRDVLLSEYAYEKAQGWINCSLDEFLELFVRGKVNGYGSWQSHVASWLDSPLSKRGDLLVARYKELKRDPERNLAQMAEFLGVQVDAEVIRAAVRNNDFQNMRKKEELTPQIGYDPRTKSIAEDKRFVRSGKVGGWRDRLTDRQLARVTEYAGETMLRLGYDLDADVCESQPRTASSAD